MASGSGDEDHVVVAIAALLTRVPADRRAAVFTAALHRLSSPVATTRDAPTARVSSRLVKPSKG
jgi:hypothetical protein